MSFLDDVVTVVTTVVNNPLPVIVPVVIGGAVLGPVGTVVGTAAGVGEVVGNAIAAEAQKAYRDQLNNAIAEVKAAVPDYAALALIWIQFNAEAFESAYKQRYGVACPPPAVLAPMIALDIEGRRKSLTDEEYKTELGNIHNGAVNGSVAQLEHERDNPDDQHKPSPIQEMVSGWLNAVLQAISYYLHDRFKSNFEGVGNESGFGAKILRGGTGISFEDIKARGLLGGDNSYLRKIIPTWSDGGGVFGGSNSFFRKPFG
jgi:hypothetical protein